MCCYIRSSPYWPKIFLDGSGCWLHDPLPNTYFHLWQKYLQQRKSGPVSKMTVKDCILKIIIDLPCDRYRAGGGGGLLLGLLQSWAFSIAQMDLQQLLLLLVLGKCILENRDHFSFQRVKVSQVFCPPFFKDLIWFPTNFDISIVDLNYFLYLSHRWD